MARDRKSQILAERGHRLPLALEARLAKHCAAIGDPAAAVLADLVEIFLDQYDADALREGVNEEASETTRELSYEPRDAAPAEELLLLVDPGWAERAALKGFLS